MIAKNVTDYYLENAQPDLAASNKTYPSLPIIESWICFDITNKVIIRGQVYNHPQYPAGKQIRTSPIEGYIAKAGHVFVTTKHSIYELGAPQQNIETENLSDWGV